MPVPLTYPGVYITEIPSGSRTITGVATSITAFVGRALRGPVDEPVTIFTYSEFARIFGGLWTLSGLGYAVRDFYANGGGEALIVRLAPGADTATLTVDSLELTASNPGAWGNALSISVVRPDVNDVNVQDLAAAQGVAAGDLFQLTVSDGGTEETFLNMTVVESSRRVDRVLESSALVRVAGELPDHPPAAGAEPAFTVEGSDGTVPVETDYVPTDPDAPPGINALLRADLFNLVCLPPPTPAENLPVGVWKAALQLCAERRAFLLVDAPGGMAVTDVADWVITDAGLTGPNARNGAVYYPRLRVADPLRAGAIADFAACGAVAGTIARTDASRGVWKAPAGTDTAITGINGLERTLTDGENGQLNPLAVNCLRTFRGQGSVIWGARTLRGGDLLADEYKYVPVRRLALFLEETLYRSTQWVVFEPNDEPLWGQIRLSVGAFMQSLFRQGAFQGTTARDAYFVRCDKETTSQYDIDRGIVNILIGFAPLKPAEFVVIGIQQKAATPAA
jgi:phage tail sheath protein FI